MHYNDIKVDDPRLELYRPWLAYLHSLLRERVEVLEGRLLDGYSCGVVREMAREAVCRIREDADFRWMGNAVPDENDYVIEVVGNGSCVEVQVNFITQA